MNDIGYDNKHNQMFVLNNSNGYVKDVKGYDTNG